MTERLTEYEETLILAHRILDRSSADPDDELAMLSRQFLRAVERVELLEKALGASAVKDLKAEWEAEQSS